MRKASTCQDPAPVGGSNPANVTWGRYHWLEGFNDKLPLTHELRSAYVMLLDLIGIHKGSVQDNDGWLAGNLQFTVKKWLALRQKLIDLGKIYETEGMLRASFVDRQFEEVNARLSSAVAASTAAAERRTAVARQKQDPKSGKNNDLGSPAGGDNRTGQDIREDSVPDGTDAAASSEPPEAPADEPEAPPPPAPVEPEKPAKKPSVRSALWAEMLPLIDQPERKARGLIGKWARDFGDHLVAAAHLLATRENLEPADYVPWMVKTMQGLKQADDARRAGRAPPRPGRSSFDDLRDSIRQDIEHDFGFDHPAPYTSDDDLVDITPPRAHQPGGAGRSHLRVVAALPRAAQG